MTNFAFMAFSAGKGYEAKSFKKYIGFAPVKVIAVNPNAKEIAAIFNKEPGEEPVYTSEIEVEGKKVKKTQIRFYLQTIPDACKGIKETFTLDYWLEDKPLVGTQSNKAKIIDKYGQTAWATSDEVKNKQIPMQKNGPAPIDNDYRLAKKGEEELTDFLKVLLNIKKRFIYNKDSRTWEINTLATEEQCMARFNNVEKIAGGDISEIKSIVKGLEENQVIKVLVGIKTTPENKQYYSVYPKVFAPWYSNYDYMKTKVLQEQSNGSFANVEFLFSELQEFEVKPTSLSEKTGIPSESLAKENPYKTDPKDNVDDLPF